MALCVDANIAVWAVFPGRKLIPKSDNQQR